MEDRGETDEGFLQAEGDGGAFVDEEGRTEQQDKEEVKEEVDEQGGSSSKASDSDDPN